MRLVSDAKDWSKWWSVRLSILGGALLTFLEIYPNVVGTIIQNLPPELKSRVDSEIFRAIGIICVLASPIARIIRQSSLDEKGNQPVKKA